MTWSALALGAGTTLLVGGSFLLTPALARPTLPLGVSVPADRVEDPAVGRALRTYRSAVLVVTAVALALTGALAAVAPPAAVAVPVLIATAGGIAAFVQARRPLMAAKASEAWFAGKAVRMSAAVTATHEDVRVPVGWYLASVVLLAGTTLVGALRYDDLPGRVPVHWDLAGSPDSYADTTWWTALAAVWIGWAALALVAALAFAATRFPVRVHPGDPVELAPRRARAQQDVAQWVLATTALATTALVCALGLDTWFSPEGLRWSVPALVLFVVAVIGCTVEAVRRYRRELAGADLPTADRRAEAPDDDRFWPGGLVYVNRQDPSVWVPKRVGIGWTINLGSPGGIAVAVGLLALVGLGIAAPLVLG
ncbi:DUF1648 domain-containing protein [Blastococcus sp. TML/M2B]|uniref:DUF5808 domain-containing protein n=1 Tax=Blastococcus sp. TML/M2B TaxID=2798727 RepID=UPI00190C33A8|nr:DUF5808 domain-containing protein [Blastococcus sp. TML/M2B]MBN1091184.1 DUF1648 domain-containing protein [Blastococcus sp. TML/M2B]